MTGQLSIERGKTAVVIMDYQNDIVSFLPEAARNKLMERAGAVLVSARREGIPVIYVVVRFREGYPEVSSRDAIRRGLRDSERLKEGTPGAEIHSAVAP